MTYPRAGLVAYNLLKIVEVIRASRLVVASVAILGPLRLRELRAATGLPERRLATYLAQAERRGALVRKGSHYWGFKTHQLPAPRADRHHASSRRRETRAQSHSVSWWLTPDRATFQEAAKRRASEQGWSA